ncbi:hypothetical protein [Xanthomarina spongicola]|uniref:Uncharacterized protein n=1 Tax=Xanthomarina spongicola TaxID=570520 RepID=A0A316DS52_9FLAO|nr:hypothetical protein [Xanthomarina spongicola]PWK20308.1 hypothetical protein LX78_00007 [Xanthomarina spongicola]
MNKLIAITYSFLILVQSFNFSFEDFSKLSVLLEHAEYHQENYGDSFLDFISEHYGESKFAHGNNHEEHEDLPFKHQHQTCAHTNAAFTLPTLNFTLEYQPFIEIPCNFYYKESSSLFEKSSVFQPPKFA